MYGEDAICQEKHAASYIVQTQSQHELWVLALIWPFITLKYKYTLLNVYMPSERLKVMCRFMADWEWSGGRLLFNFHGYMKRVKGHVMAFGEGRVVTQWQSTHFIYRRSQVQSIRFPDRAEKDPFLKPLNPPLVNVDLSQIGHWSDTIQCCFICSCMLLM